MEAAKSGFRPAPKARLRRLCTLSGISAGRLARPVQREMVADLSHQNVGHRSISLSISFICGSPTSRGAFWLRGWPVASQAAGGVCWGRTPTVGHWPLTWQEGSLGSQMPGKLPQKVSADLVHFMWVSPPESCHCLSCLPCSTSPHTGF